MKSIKLKIAMWGTGIVSLLFIGAYVLQFSKNGWSTDTQDWANFGAYMTPVFMMITMIVMFYTITKQNEAHIEQQFESTFFNSLVLHKEILNSIKTIGDNGKNKGKELFGNDACLELARVIDAKLDFISSWAFNPDSTYGSFNKSVFNVKLNTDCDTFYTENTNLYRYFTNLYLLYKSINESKVKDKKKYSRILRAQLSNQERVLIFYNGLIEDGKDFKPLLEEYGVFNNFNQAEYNTQLINFLYHEKAFK